MASKAARGVKLFYMPKKGPFNDELGSRIPEAYRKFYYEWKHMKPAAVHHIPPVKEIDVDPQTGEIKRFQDYPIPIIYPREHNDGLWGGEGVIRGFQKRHPIRRRVAHFWVPTLKKSIVYSEVLNKHMEVVVTDRLLRLIHENYGFDHYLLKTPACDLKSTLALQLKRNMLLALINKDMYHTDLEKQEQIYTIYKKYSDQYTIEEIEWYGLTVQEARRKQQKIEASNNQPEAMKNKYRLSLLQRLKEAGIAEASIDEDTGTTKKSWLSRINVFSKDGQSSV